MQPLLIDTCTVLWFLEDAAISEMAASALGEASSKDIPIFVSPITAWEVGMLASKARLTMIATPERWFTLLLAVPGVHLAEMPPRILIASSFLPGKPPSDPADRIIAATARDLDATLMTRDRLLLGYGEQGHVRVIAC